MAEDEGAEKDTIVAWHSLTSDGRWNIVMGHAGQLLMQAHLVCSDPKKPEAERLVAMGEVKAWSAVRVWREQFRAAYDALAADQAKADEPEELVGAKLEEQWYSKE